MDLSIFILAGGRSTRMGTDKALLEVAGSSLAESAVQKARSLASEQDFSGTRVALVGPAGVLSRFGPVIQDRIPDCGPLGGIHAALAESTTDLNLFFAVDMPLVTPELFLFLAQEAARSTAVVTIPRAGGRLQPLCAVYRRGFLPLVEQALRDGRLKIDSLFEHCATRVIEEDELARFAFSPTMFHNLNTPRDLESLRGIERTE